MPAGMKDSSLVLPTDIEATDIVTGATKKVKGWQPFELTDTPLLIAGLPANVLTEAKANAAKNFPWGGDHTAAKTVACQPGSPDANSGISQLRRNDYPIVKFADGSTGILVQGDITHPVSFYVHPSFAKLLTKEYSVRATVRRVAAGNVGMNLLYEVADSQGRSPYANTGKWGGTTKDDGWQTISWHVTDACFSKMWGNDITLRPELSVPFVIGKVEVSTEAFK
jgi:hypothetical protein